MTRNKKAVTHVVGLILALSLFVYCGKMASHFISTPGHSDLFFWSGLALVGLVAALGLTGMMYVAFGAEAAAHPRPRFAPLLRRMDGPVLASRRSAPL